MHRWHAGKVDDDRLVRTVLARDLFMIARAHIDAGERRRARVTFAQSLRLRIMPRALVFVLVLSLPERHARRAVAMLVELKHAIVRATTRSLGRGRWMSRGGLAHGEDRAAWADYGTD
jgi:hypothetical protein